MYVCSYVCMHTCMYVCMHAWMDGCMHVSMQVCRYVCRYVGRSICMHVCMYVYIYTYISLYNVVTLRSFLDGGAVATVVLQNPIPSAKMLEPSTTTQKSQIILNPSSQNRRHQTLRDPTVELSNSIIQRPLQSQLTADIARSLLAVLSALLFRRPYPTSSQPAKDWGLLTHRSLAFARVQSLACPVKGLQLHLVVEQVTFNLFGVVSSLYNPYIMEKKLTFGSP